MDYRWSASLHKVKKQCEFRFYCKVTKKEIDTEVEQSYGDAGTVMHKVIEKYYSQDKPFLEIKESLQKDFDELWTSYDIQNKKLNKDEYWLCVINAIRLKLTVTDLEHKFVLSEPVNFVGYADVINRENHWVGDWKSSTYKSSKVKEYKEQLKFYAWAYWKETGTVPKFTWVFFNKVNKIFKFYFKENDLLELEKELVQLEYETQKQFKDLDFPRNPEGRNCFFCPYKKICSTDHLKNDEINNIKIHLKENKLVIEGAIPEATHRRLEAHCNFEVKNAFFIKQVMAKRGQKWDGIKRLYRRKAYGADSFIGYARKVYTELEKIGLETGRKTVIRIIDHRNKDDLDFSMQQCYPDKLNIPFELYEFQKEAIDILLYERWGICEIGTGGGKTVIAAECIQQIKGKTLFVIDNKDLLLQTKKEYEEMFGFECGIVGLGKRDWNFPIVLSTIQTLAKHAAEFSFMLRQVNVVIYDECHGVACKSHETLSKYLVNSKYRLSFSATARRDDGNTKIIFAHCGEVVYKKDADELINEDVLVKPKVTFYKYNSKKVIADKWQNEYEAGIVNNEVRNNMIIDMAKGFADAGKQIMILCTRISHCQELLERLGKYAKLIYGKTDDEIRVEVLEAFKRKEFPVLVGNLKIFNKGINIKVLDILINAAGNAGEVTTQQTLGRILRKSPGKEEALYIDFIDNGEYLLKHSKSRMKILEEEGHIIEIEGVKK